MKNKSKTTSVSAQATSPEKPTRRTRKQQGEVIELAFLHKAAELGFAVTKPYGDSEAYDFVVDSGSRLWRVQVRSTDSKSRQYSYYSVHNTYHSETRTYGPDEIDFLVAHTAPDLAWYIIPACALAGRPSIYLFPHRKAAHALYECFREAWCLMACRRDPKVRDSITVEPRCGSSDARASESTCPLLQKNRGGPGASRKRSRRTVTRAADSGRQK